MRRSRSGCRWRGRGGSRGRGGRTGLPGRSAGLRSGCAGLRRAGHRRSRRERGAGRTEAARTTLVGPVRRTVGLGRWWSAGHRPGLRAHERADVLRRVRKHCHVPRALERGREHPLVLGAVPALPAGIDLAALADVPADPTDFLEVDLLRLIDAERADLAARAASTAGSAATTAVARTFAAVTAAVTGAVAARTAVARSVAARTRRPTGRSALRRAGPRRRGLGYFLAHDPFLS